MSKFKVTYHLEADSLEDATAFAYLTLLESDDDCVTDVHVEAIQPTLWGEGFLTG